MIPWLRATYFIMTEDARGRVSGLHQCTEMDIGGCVTCHLSGERTLGHDTACTFRPLIPEC